MSILYFLFLCSILYSSNERKTERVKSTQQQTVFPMLLSQRHSLLRQYRRDVESCEAFSEIKLNDFFDTLILQIYFLIIEIYNFQGDLTDISAKKLHWLNPVSFVAGFRTTYCSPSSVRSARSYVRIALLLPVLLLAKLNYTFVGYFDPENVVLGNENKYFFRVTLWIFRPKKKHCCYVGFLSRPFSFLLSEILLSLVF